MFFFGLGLEATAPFSSASNFFFDTAISFGMPE
jgi:hypothetical protein